MRVVIDAGHGGRDSGARGARSLEKEINLAVALKVAALLSGHVDVTLTRSDDKDFVTGDFVLAYDLRGRTKVANDSKADLFLSIHNNAPKPGKGTETYHFPGSVKGEAFARQIHSRVVEALGFPDRGVKTARFHVLRETVMPAALVELGFITDDAEESALLQPETQDKVAFALANGILSTLELPILSPSEKEGGARVLPPTQTPLLGPAVASQEQAIALAEKRNPSLPWYVPLVIQFVYMLGSLLGVRADLVVGLMMHETGFWKYGGDVKESQYNFGGIGATGGVLGNAFANWMAGAIAVMQHVWAYATDAEWPEWMPYLDPRFHLVSRGIAPNVEDLGGRWAYPGYDRKKYPSLEAAKLARDSYGHHILHMVELMKGE